MTRSLSPLLALLLMFGSGCSDKELPSEPTRMTGTLKGKIYLASYDPAEYPLPTDSATISIDGTNISTTADSNGYWVLNNLPAGIHNITFSRPGFAPYREIGYQFVGGGTAYFKELISLCKTTIVTVSELRAEIKETSIFGGSQLALHLTGTMTASPTFSSPCIYFLIGHSDTISINNRQGVLADQVNPRSGDQFEHWIHLSSLGGFQSGETIHIVAYGFMPVSKYYDPELRMDIFTNYTAPVRTSLVNP